MGWILYYNISGIAIYDQNHIVKVVSVFIKAIEVNGESLSEAFVDSLWGTAWSSSSLWMPHMCRIQL
jgi:hypothetical protein